MRKHKSSSAVAVAEKPAALSFVVVDFPQEAEVIVSSEYTLRIGASADARAVEISLDGGDWLACRPAVGFWWFDWSNFSRIAHRVSARVSTHEGKTHFSDPRKFSVKLPAAGGAVKKTSKISKVKKKLTKMLGDAGINIG